MNDFNLSVPEFEQFMVKSISKAIASEYVKDIEDSNSESQELEANPVEVENTTEYKLAPSMPQMFDQIIINIEPSVARKFQALIALAGDECKENICSKVSSLIDPILTEQIAESVGIKGSSVGLKIKAEKSDIGNVSEDTDPNYTMGDVSDEEDEEGVLDDVGDDSENDSENVSDPFAKLGSGLSAKPPKPIKQSNAAKFKEGRIVPGSMKIRSRVSGAGDAKQISADMSEKVTKKPATRATKPQSTPKTRGRK